MKKKKRKVSALPKNDAFLPVEQNEEIKISMNDYMELRFKKSYGIATYVCDEMSKILHVKLHENELGYLAMHIQRCIEEIESEIQEEGRIYEERNRNIILYIPFDVM